MINISTKQIQKQTLSPFMHQSIEVLLLDVMDLSTAITQEIEKNPLLEINEEELESYRYKSLQIKNNKNQQDTPNYNYNQANNTPEEDPDNEQFIKNYIELEDMLLEQLKYEVNDPEDIAIGEYIIGNLDNDGYLNVTLQDIAENTGADIENVKRILSIIQSFEPSGIAARDLNESLYLQATSRNLNGLGTIVNDIIYHFIPELGRKKYSDIARKLKVDVERVKEAAKVISSLDPKPARNFRQVKGNIYIIPDVIISKDEDSGVYSIHLSKESIPPLRINNKYKKMLDHPGLKPEEKEFIQDKMRKAASFMQSIEKRGETMRKIAEYILERQKGFFENGISALVPMTLENAAEALGRNKSTISRAINNKYIDTPLGLFSIKTFFSQGINEQTNGSISSKSIKEEIYELVTSEDKSSPLSDTDIQRHFEGKGIKIARRTISKYRQGLNFLPSHLRKEN